MKKEYDLEKPLVIITGASSGLGAAMAVEFSNSGFI
jgi:NADP-dependent 3-hydroxy acid dehydrogenase YdfG